MTDSFLLGVILAIVLILVLECRKSTHIDVPNQMPSSDAETYLDYRPGGYVNACPSHFRCGAASRDQVQLENSLHTRLRETEKYFDAENPTDDQYHVPSSKAEPTVCTMRRAASAKEGLYPNDGMHTPHSEIEKKMSTTHSSRIAQLASMLKAQPKA